MKEENEKLNWQEPGELETLHERKPNQTTEQRLCCLSGLKGDGEHSIFTFEIGDSEKFRLEEVMELGTDIRDLIISELFKTYNVVYEKKVQCKNHSSSPYSNPVQQTIKLVPKKTDW